MIDQCELLRSAMSEYASLLTAQKDAVPPNAPERLARALSPHHDWTESGAQAVVYLASRYGAFMLRNALALAIVLRKEDGDLDF